MVNGYNTETDHFRLQYHTGQLYMIAKHSHEQSERGEGVHVVKNIPVDDPKHGKGQYTEKRIYLSRWVQYSVLILFTQC